MKRELSTIWLLLFAMATVITFSARSAWANDCGDNFPPGSDTPCSCGDTVKTDTVLKPSDPVTRVTCDPVNSFPSTSALSVAKDVTLDVSSPSAHIRCAAGLVGLDIVGTGVTIKGGSTIIDHCDIGVFVRRTSDGARIERLVVRNSGFAGFLVSANFTTLLDNRCDNTQGSGIVVVGDTNTLDSNYCQKNAQDGISVGGDANILTGNLCHDNTVDGISIGGINNTLEGNYCKGNGFDGIHVVRGGNTLNHNQGKTNGGNGVFANPSVSNNTDFRNYGNGNGGPNQCQINNFSKGKSC